MSKKREREIREVPALELRADDDNGQISGYAAVFDQTAPIWDFDEVIRRGAFKKTIKDKADVFAFWSHNHGAVLGRTLNDTLRLAEDEHGLHVEIDPPDTPTAQEVRTLIREGFVDKMSFGFEVIKQVWRTREGKPDLREILEVRLFEVSPVPLPAFDGTSVVARGAKPERPEEDNEKDQQPTRSDTQAEPSPEAHSLACARLRLAEKNQPIHTGG